MWLRCDFTPQRFRQARDCRAYLEMGMFRELPPFDIPDPSLDDFRRVLTVAGIPIEDDEPGLEFVSFQFRECLCYCSAAYPRVAVLPLAYFDDTELEDRGAFDLEYTRVRHALSADLGDASAVGSLTFEHRAEGQDYNYSVWQLQFSRLVLAQGERDIQFGLDLSLWFLYDAGEIELLIERHY